MAKPEGDSQKTSGKEVKKVAGGMARFCASVALVAALLYILYGVAIGLESVRREVCDRISDRLGVKVEAESSELGLPFAIVLKNVKTEGYEYGAAGFVFQKLRLAPGIGGHWHVSCERGSLRLACGRDNVWGPSGLAALGPVAESDLSQVSRFTGEFCSSTTLEMSDLTVRWVHADGEVAAAGGVSFVVRPAELPDRTMLFHALRAASVAGPGGERAAGIRREWLSGVGMPYKELFREGGEGSGKGVFWEGTKQ